jgi:hypothetical protein
MPDIDEFIEAASKARAFTVSSPDFPEIDERLKKEQLTHDQIHTLIMIPLCEKHNVIPFWSLVFDNGLRQFNEAEIKYCGYRFDILDDSEPYKSCAHPIHFTKGSKWYSIRFVDAAGEENVGRTKLAIVKFIEQGYRVVSMSAQLEPFITTGEYVNYKESKASLYANNGKITIYGEVPEEFKKSDIETILKRKPAPALPSPPKLLENIAESLVGKSQ